jgi:hypothetical protein
MEWRRSPSCRFVMEKLGLAASARYTHPWRWVQS